MRRKMTKMERVIIAAEERAARAEAQVKRLRQRIEDANEAKDYQYRIACHWWATLRSVARWQLGAHARKREVDDLVLRWADRAHKRLSAESLHEAAVESDAALRDITRRFGPEE